MDDLYWNQRRWESAPPVSKHLDTITDWPVLAKQAHYHVGELARILGVSTRSLEDYFKVKRHTTPHAYFAQLRIREIQRLARSDQQGKAMYEQLRFAHFSSFSRALHRDFDRTLRQIRKTDRMSACAKS